MKSLYKLSSLCSKLGNISSNLPRLLNSRLLGKLGFMVPLSGDFPLSFDFNTLIWVKAGKKFENMFRSYMTTLHCFDSSLLNNLANACICFINELKQLTFGECLVH